MSGSRALSVKGHDLLAALGENTVRWTASPPTVRYTTNVCSHMIEAQRQPSIETILCCRPSPP